MCRRRSTSRARLCRSRRASRSSPTMRTSTWLLSRRRRDGRPPDRARPSAQRDPADGVGPRSDPGLTLLRPRSDPVYIADSEMVARREDRENRVLFQAIRVFLRKFDEPRRARVLLLRTRMARQKRNFVAGETYHIVN